MSAMEGWQSITFGEVCKFTGGNGFREELQGQKDGDYPFIKVSDMELPSNKKTIVEANNWIDEKTRRNDAFKAFPENSVVFAKVGAALLLNRRRILTRPTCIDNNMMAAVPNDIAPLFLFYLLEDLDFAIFVQSGAVPSINQAQLSCISFELPQSKPEQTKIAEILSTVDRAIEQTEALIAKQQRIKTGLMQDLLTRGIDEHGNLRSEQTHKFKDSLLGRIPLEWEVKELGIVAFVTKLAGFEFTNYFDYRSGGKIIALRALNIKNERLDLTDIQRIPKAVSEKLPRSKIFADDILITYIGAYIGDLLRIEESDKYHLAPNIAKIVAGKLLAPKFLEVFLRSSLVQRQIKNLTAVTATPSLTMTQIRKLLIAVPKGDKEQTELTSHIRALSKALDSIETEANKLRLLKTALMQDLLTGTKRVTVLLNDMEAVRE